MDKLLNSSFLKKLSEVGQKMSAQRHLSAISGGLMTCVSFMLLGSIFQIIAQIPFAFIQDNKQYIMAPYNMTMGIIAILTAVAVAYRLAGSYKMKPLINGLTSGVIFMLTVSPAQTLELADGAVFTGLDATYLGAQGIFVAMLVAIITVEITRFCQQKNIVIKLPDAVPSAMGDSFTAIIPVLFSVVLFQGANLILNKTLGLDVPTGLMKLLALPLSAIESIPGMLLAILFALILWLLGIHGTAVVVPFYMPIAIQAAATNAALLEAGEPLVFSAAFLFGSIACCGGTGNTLGLCILGWNSKSKQIKSISRASLIPGLFGINEPVMYGMPMVLNPVLAIPYLLCTVTIFLLMWAAYATGFMAIPYIAVNAVLPMGVGEFMKSLSWTNAIFPYLMIIISLLFYAPFFKIYEKQCVEKERAAEAEMQCQKG